MDLNASWAVEYDDGSVLRQYDASHPDFDPVGGEVPLRKIDWTRVTRVEFASQWATDTFDFAGVPDGQAMRLIYRARHGLSGSASCFMLTCVKADAPIVLQTTDVLWVQYWFPDGVLHTCTDYNCHDVAMRLIALLKGEIAPIQSTH